MQTASDERPGISILSGPVRQLNIRPTAETSPIQFMGWQAVWSISINPSTNQRRHQHGYERVRKLFAVHAADPSNWSRNARHGQKGRKAKSVQQLGWKKGAVQFLGWKKEWSKCGEARMVSGRLCQKETEFWSRWSHLTSLKTSTGLFTTHQAKLLCPTQFEGPTVDQPGTQLRRPHSNGNTPTPTSPNLIFSSLFSRPLAVIRKKQLRKNWYSWIFLVS